MTKHRQHQFVGQPEGDALALLLNSWQKKKAGQILAQLVEDYNRLDAEKKAARAEFAGLIGRKAKEAKLSGRSKITLTGADFPSFREHSKIARRIERVLARCWVRPRLSIDGDRMELGWRQESPLSQGARLIVMLAQMGLLHQMKSCAKDDCGEWFFAKSPQHGKYCSVDCQRRDYQNSEEWKKKRREQRRRNYHYGASKPSTAAT